MKDSKTVADYREQLLKMRKETEEEILKLGQQLAAVNRDDYDKNYQFVQEKARVKSLGDMKFAYLKRINRRIDEIDQGTFTGKCRCGKPIEKRVLKTDPDRTLCINCQKEENGKRK